MHKRILILLVCFILSSPDAAVGQAKRVTSPLCTQDNALETVRQQVELAKTFYANQRIVTLIRAADLFWPYQQDKARAFFREAFDLAVEDARLNADMRNRSRSLLIRMHFPDHRHIVIRAVAKRDSAWAKVLVQQLTKLEAEATGTSQSRDSFDNTLTGNRLVQSANLLLPTDMNAAIELARSSFNYPASFMLTYFLYQLAAVNQPAADQLYAQALVAYGDKPMQEFLYLQAYPFAWRETVNTPVFSFHENIPSRFVPNKTLQRQLVQTMLSRAQEALQIPLHNEDGYKDQSGTWMPNTVHLLHGLTKLEPQVEASLPDLAGALHEAREKILVSISVENQQQFLEPGREASVKANESFADQIESALKETDVFERDEHITTAVFGAGAEPLGNVIQALDKISDSDLRNQLAEWFYFQRAAMAAKEKQFDEAERLTSKLEDMEQRAFLHVEIAKGLVNKNDARAGAVLDVAISEAKKAGTTIFAARTLLTAASLYAKIDASRAIEVLSDAIECINRIDMPDFTRDDQALEKMLTRRGTEGEYKGDYAFRFYMPGMDPESAFRETGKIDFDTALSQSNALKDKFQRTLTSLALADVCLQQMQRRPRPKK